jgi:RNA polymerase sigma-70 factor (ECF subfamily)
MSVEQQDFPTIYEEYYPKIVGYLRKHVGDVEAEDVAQEVFVKVSRSLDSFRGESQLSTWIYRIATNTAMDHFRKPSTQQALRTQDIPVENDLQGNDINVVPADNTPLSDTLLIQKDMNECIRGLVNDLPDNYRTVLAIGDLEGFTNAEIADILGLSLDTVKIRLHRARLKLKKAMDRACHLYHDKRNELACDRKPATIEFKKNKEGVSFSG